MMFIYVIVLAIAFIALKIYIKWNCGMCTCKTKMVDKVVIVTGANSGIGFETAKDLARRGAKVILACRDQDKGLLAKNIIIEATGNKNVVFKQLDFSSLRSVKAFADDILSTEPVLHVLVNNAGTGKLDNSLTEDGLLKEAQVNHFGPFMLTVLLLTLLKSSAPSRIVNVSSVLHKAGKVDPANFHKQARNYLEHRRVYSNTKLANILFTLKLSKELKGTGVTANCLHPGAVHTGIFRNRPKLVRYILSLLFKTPYEGAQTSIYLSVSPELDQVTGKYFVDCKEATPSKTAQDDELAEKLWTLSREVLHASAKLED